MDVFTSTQAMRVAGCTYRQIDYWRRTGVVTPSIQLPRGSGDPCIWSLDDVVKLRLVRLLVESGVSVQRCRPFMRLLDAEPEAEVLLVDSGSVYACRDETELMAFVRHARGAVQFIRLGDIRREVADRTAPIAV